MTEPSLENLISGLPDDGHDFHGNSPLVSNPSLLQTLPEEYLKGLENDTLVPFYVPLLKPQILSSLIRDDNIFEYPTIIANLKGLALQKVLDFDAWYLDKSENSWALSSERMADWIVVWKTISNSFCAEQFFSLPEEMIVPLLSSVFEIRAVGINPDPEEGSWETTPDKRFFYKFKEPFDSEKQEVYYNLVKDLYDRDFLFSGSIFSYASFLDKNEVLDTALRFRNARMADSGLPSKDEALLFLKPINVDKCVLDFDSGGDNLSKETTSLSLFYSYMSDDLEDNLPNIIGDNPIIIKPLKKVLLDQMHTEDSTLSQDISVCDDDFLKEEGSKTVIVNFLVNSFLKKYYFIDSVYSLMPAEPVDDLIIYSVLRKIKNENDLSVLLGVDEQFKYALNCLCVLCKEHVLISHEKYLKFILETVNLSLEYLLFRKNLIPSDPKAISLAYNMLVSHGFPSLFKFGWTLLSQLRLQLGTKLNSLSKREDSELIKEDFSNTSFTNFKRAISSNNFSSLRRFVFSNLESFDPALEHAVEGFVFPLLKLSSVIMTSNVKVQPYYVHIASISHYLLAKRFIDNLHLNKEP